MIQLQVIKNLAAMLATAKQSLHPSQHALCVLRICFAVVFTCSMQTHAVSD
jgi:hypothetical protein